MKLISGIILAVLFALTSLSGQSPKIEFVEFDLDNGLHVILHQDNSTPIVAVNILYHVGSKNEDPERTGFAHFFEHLLFEGSENIERGEFMDLVNNAGGTLNAYTTFDKTNYYQILPSNQLELGLYLESERLLHAKIDSAGIETQRQVVKEERRSRYDNQPYGTIWEEVFKRSYKVHPYNWTTIGSMEHIDAAEDHEFIEFYRTFYVPENAVLSVAGDIEIEETKKLVGKYFSEIPRGGHEIPRPNQVEPPQTAEVRDVVYDNIQLPAVIQSYHIPALGTDDYYAVSMLSQLLSQGESSRLNKSVKDQQQKAVAVGSFPFDLEDPGVTIAYGIANSGVSPEDLEAAMEAEYDKVKNELISEEEFQKLRNQIENDFVSGNSRVAGIAESLANYHMYYGDADLINTEIARYMKVTREDIQRVANKYFTKENRVVLYYLPKSAQQQPENTEIDNEG